LLAYLVADRLEDEARENEKRRDELAELKGEMRQKERCLSELSSQNDCLRAELDLAATKLDKYSREADAANQRYVLYSSASAGQWSSRTFGRSERSSHLPPFRLRFWKLESLFKVQVNVIAQDTDDRYALQL